MLLLSVSRTNYEDKPASLFVALVSRELGWDGIGRGLEGNIHCVSATSSSKEAPRPPIIIASPPNLKRATNVGFGFGTTKVGRRISVGGRKQTMALTAEHFCR